MIGPGFIDDLDNDLCGDFFDHIDDLLDFPMEDGEGEGGGGGGVCDGFQGGCWPPVTDALAGSTNTFLSGKNGYTTTPELPTELSIPYEDIAQLEWLSNFVEDSFSAGSIIVEKDSSSFVGNIINSNNNKKAKNSSNNDNDNEKDKHSHRFQTSSPVSVLDSSSSCSDGNGMGSGSSSGGFMRTMPLSPETFVPGRARSKRRRPASFNPRTLISLISPTSSSATEDPNTFSTSESATEFDNYAESHTLKKIYFKSIALASVEEDHQQQQQKKKKKKKLPPPPPSPAYSGSAGGTDQPLAVRKCLHCEITKTPQWRAGPLGPKTLCNACGVRYKSGRLFPEYRPAASPTFVASVHSNSHKKVLEMRSNVAPKSSFLPATTVATPELVPNNNPLLDYI